MTNVSYILTNGTVVSTLKEAQLSGQGYTMRYTPVKKLTEKVTKPQGNKKQLQTGTLHKVPALFLFILPIDK